MLGASLLAATIACGNVQPGETEPALPAQIVFINESLEQADVYAATPGGETVRIGTVMAGRRATLTVPPQFVARGSVTIAVRLNARSLLLSSGPVAISAGERVQIRLPLSANTLSVLPTG
jgi:hypothetical protein